MSKTVIASAEDLAIGLSCPSLRRCSAPLAHRNALPAGPTKRFICTLDASRELHCLGAGLTIDAHVAILAKEHEIFVIAPFSRVLSRTTGCGGWQVAS